MIPLFLTIIVIIRIGYEEIVAKYMPSLLRKLESIKKTFTVTSSKEEKKYSKWVLLAISLGATIGPSTFVLVPYTVIKYGLASLPGFILASIIAWLLAWRMSVMYYYSKYRLREKIVGEPDFVKIAYSKKDPRYLLSRFMMWIGNSALAAFNMLITIDLFSNYFYSYFAGRPFSFLEKLVLLFLLSAIILVLYRAWEGAVNLQNYVTIVFIILFFLHMIGLGYEYSLIEQFRVKFTTGFSIDLLFYTLTAAAYVFMVTFGFQEVMGLGENVEGENPDEKFRNLKKAMIGGSLLANLITLLYIFELLALSQVNILPLTPVPVLDILSRNPLFYWLTFITIILGMTTTLIPVFVASLKHLEQFTEDFFGVRTTALLPYLVIFLAWFLFTSGAEFLIHLMDYAVLVSFGIIALSEKALRERAGDIRGGKKLGTITFILTLIMFLALAYESRAIAEESILFMWISTVLIMVLSYNILLAEIFTIIVGILTAVFTSPLLGLLADLASLGLLAPVDIPVYQATIIALWTLYIALASLIIHLIMKHKQLVENILIYTIKLIYKIIK